MEKEESAKGTEKKWLGRQEKTKRWSSPRSQRKRVSMRKRAQKWQVLLAVGCVHWA